MSCGGSCAEEDQRSLPQIFSIKNKAKESWAESWMSPCCLVISSCIVLPCHFLRLLSYWSWYLVVVVWGRERWCNKDGFGFGWFWYWIVFMFPVEFCCLISGRQMVQCKHQLNIYYSRIDRRLPYVREHVIHYWKY